MDGWDRPAEASERHVGRTEGAEDPVRVERADGRRGSAEPVHVRLAGAHGVDEPSHSLTINHHSC